MMVNAEPVAYIRRSARSRSDPGDVSREFQTDKVRDLAGSDASRLRVIDEDWGRSAATDKTGKREAFLALLDDVERGAVSAIYAYSLDRLARSVRWAAQLLDACRVAGTTIVTSEGRFEPDNPGMDMMFHVMAAQNEGYSRQALQKRRATVVRQRERGDKLGPAFYGALPGEDLAAVLAAFAATGSAHAAARELNKQGIPTRRRERVNQDGTVVPIVWTHGTVRHILVREGRMPKLGTRGAKPQAPFTLYRLLRCHCGRTMTAANQKYGKASRRTIYRCVTSSADPSHGPKTISERNVLPWIMAEAARFDPRRKGGVAACASSDEQVIESLDTRRTVIEDMYETNGPTWRDEYRRRLARVDADLAIVEMRRELVTIPPGIDWTWPPQDINAILRTYWTSVRLDTDMQPIKVDWRLPEEWLT